MFGVCYYPEQWPESDWHEDAAMMAELGLTYVRIGEFSWSKLEPEDGQYDYDWLDRAIDVLVSAGLKIIIGTPTATPPKWLIDKYPEVLPRDPLTGQIRGFGSRRHYDFSSDRYLTETIRITEQLAGRYGSHPGVVGWQTDNELCCHDTTLSVSPAAKSGFQRWCEKRYANIDALNSVWGNVFWSMEYESFDAIELPFAAVTETNPAHKLAFRRYSSDRVIEFHQNIADAIRPHAQNQFITHNFIPMSDTGVDDWALAEPLDFACYDNYPLGRTDGLMSNESTTEFKKYMRTGHPDLASYTHDQVRCLKNQRFWVMEQQPGPVNWAANNARPAPGMVRFWTIEAFAHGAECVSYFRWRQVPFAQEQMHAGVLRVDRSKTELWSQVQQVQGELDQLGVLEESRAPSSIAIVSCAESEWVSEIEQQGAAYRYEDVQFLFYRALRELGVNVDFISRHDDFDRYSLVIAPSLPILDDVFVTRCSRSKARIIFGPRAGAKTCEFSIPATLAPGVLQTILPIRVLSVETLRDDCAEELLWNGKTYQSVIWREELSVSGGKVLASYSNGDPAIVQAANAIYMGTLFTLEFARDFLRDQCHKTNIELHEYGLDIRVVQRGELMFAFNYSQEHKELPIPDSIEFLLGGRSLPPRDIAVWRA